MGGAQMELLERAAFLDTLAEYAAEARQGDGRLVLVAGESGMGKTALVEAFQADLSSARWLWGACDGLFTPRPLGPLFDIGAQTDGELAGLCRDNAARDRLFAALLAELSSPAFTVTVIEDAHWADEATIDLISFAGRRLARLRGLLLVTYRDDELAEDHPLRRVLGDLATQRATRRMKLPPLSVAAVRTLAGQHEVDVAELHRVTGGNPFYVSEILGAGWPSVPPTVRDAVAARLARLSPGTRGALEAAAVIGTRVPREQITVLASEPEAAVADCLTAGLLEPDGSGLRFRHEFVRMAVEAAIPAPRKARLHVRLLAELERGGTADPAVLAHHAAGPATSRPSCGTPRPRHGAPRHSARTARPPLITSTRWPAPISSPRQIARRCRRRWPVSTHCSTGGPNRSRCCSPRWRSSGTSATRSAWAGCSGSCQRHCGASAGGRNPSGPSTRQWRCWKRGRQARSWHGHTRAEVWPPPLRAGPEKAMTSTSGPGHLVSASGSRTS